MFSCKLTSFFNGQFLFNKKKLIELKVRYAECCYLLLKIGQQGKFQLETVVCDERFSKLTATNINFRMLTTVLHRVEDCLAQGEKSDSWSILIGPITERSELPANVRKQAAQITQVS